MAPDASAKVLASALQGPPRPRTIADAAAESGLALRDAERGLHELTREYRGHLRATENGDLLFVFPTGFTKPWQTRDALARVAAGLGRALTGALRFVVRAWLTIVLVGYALLFVAVIIALTFARQSNDNNRSAPPVGAIAGAFFRALVDALFWTFHPFSPFAVNSVYGGGYGDSSFGGRAQPVRGMRGGRSDAPKDETPFYEKINRFFFGPTEAPPDPLLPMKRVLAEIRAQKGRIGLADVMRVTGLPREAADPLMAKLMLDYDGDVVVSEEGGITYRFPDLRRTAVESVTDTPAPRPEPAWARAPKMPPLTGNSFESNALIVGLNFFNIVMAGVAIEKGLTLDNLQLLLHRIPAAMLPHTSTPVFLGLVPLFFSLALLLIPVGRALVRPFKARAVAKESARLAVLREVLARSAAKEPLAEEALAKAWANATGNAPTTEELTRVVVAYGGDVDVEASGVDGKVRYRFVDLEAEAQALEEERDAAGDEEKRVGKVVFASDSN